MRNGTHKFFIIQQRKRAENKWLADDSPLKTIPASKRGEWSDCGEYWLKSTVPYHGTGNNWRPRNRPAADEWRDVYDAAQYRGWYTRKYAVAALKRLRDDDKAGCYDTKDSYGKRHQRVRHEFQLVEVEVVYELTQMVIPKILEDNCVKPHRRSRTRIRRPARVE